MAVGLLGTQCLDSISDDCSKTLTCPDDQQPVLNNDCTWEYPDGRPWPGGPKLDTATNTWRWPDGKPTDTQDFDCTPGLADAGVDGGSGGPRCGVTFDCDPGRTCDPVTGECFECLTDTECAGNMPVGDAGAASFCDTASHRCVQCVNDDNCSGDTDFCKIDAANTRRNRCVECLGDDQCTEPNTRCDERSNECTLNCDSPDDCTGDKKACNTELGYCVECTGNTQCATSDTKPLCDVGSNQCVECLGDSECAATGRVCDLESHSCVECKTDEQCAAGPNGATLKFCDLEAKQCVACLNDDQCTDAGTSRCNVVAHVCTGCTDSTQCESGVCSTTGTTAGRCVECASSGDCNDPTRPHCESASGACVECLLPRHCPAAGLAHCNTPGELLQGEPPYTCVRCQGNEDCTGDGKTLPPLCDLANGVCSQCTIAEGLADCSDFGPALSRCQGGTCTACSVDDDCEFFGGAPNNRPACNPGVGCVECTDSTDCADTPGTLVCKIAAGQGPDAGGGPAAVNTCVECVNDTQCRTDAGAARCNNNQCVPCVADTDCEGFDSNGTSNGGTLLEVCDGGTCVQCAGEKRDACQEDVCNGLTKACAPGRQFRSADLCDDCVSDFECAENARCVQQTFDGQAIGFFCFPLATGTPPACAGPRIFLDDTTSATIDQLQPTPTVCQPPRTTCVALDALANAVDCNNAADCGFPAVDDGLCDADLDLCTVPCNSGADCSGACDLVAGACELN